jgi:hypothetical protein
LTLACFAGDCQLIRLSLSEFADRFIPKGAALLLIWLGEPWARRSEGDPFAARKLIHLEA